MSKFHANTSKYVDIVTIFLNFKRADIFFGRGVPNILGGRTFLKRKIGRVIKFLMTKM